MTRRRADRGLQHMTARLEAVIDEVLRHALDMSGVGLDPMELDVPDAA
jgi:hypothetical protein